MPSWLNSRQSLSSSSSQKISRDAVSFATPADTPPLSPSKFRVCVFTSASSFITLVFSLLALVQEQTSPSATICRVIRGGYQYYYERRILQISPFSSLCVCVFVLHSHGSLSSSVSSSVSLHFISCVLSLLDMSGRMTGGKEKILRFWNCVWPRIEGASGSLKLIAKNKNIRESEMCDTTPTHGRLISSQII